MAAAAKLRPSTRALLREREQRRQHDDAEMADAAGVHVLAHQAVARDAVGEDRVGGRRADVRPDDRAGASARGRERRGLPGPGQRMGLERAGKEIEQADLELVARGGRKVVVDACRRSPRQAGPASGRSVGGGASARSRCGGTRHEDLPDSGFVELLLFQALSPDWTAEAFLCGRSRAIGGLPRRMV